MSISRHCTKNCAILIYHKPKQFEINHYKLHEFQGDKDPFIRNIFTLNTCSAIVGSQVLSYMKEADMLTAWANFVRDCDPDIITGYNVQNFDLGYLLNRAQTLKANLFPYLGRLRNNKTTERKVMLQSKQMGKRENKQINIEGVNI